MFMTVPTTTTLTAFRSGMAAVGHVFDASSRIWDAQGTSVSMSVREPLGACTTGVTAVADASIPGTSVWRPPIC